MSCPIIINQPMINEIITENPVLKQLLDDRYITIKSFDKAFNFNPENKDNWCNEVMDNIESGIILKGLGLGWVRKHVIEKIYDTLYTEKCDYTGLCICINNPENELYGKDDKDISNYFKSMNGYPIGLIVVRNILREDITTNHFDNIYCDRRIIPADKVAVGELIAANPDFASYGLGKILFSALLLLTFKLGREAVVTEIAHGLSNIAGKTLYESFGFKASPVEIGTLAGQGSTLVSLITYIPRRIQQQYTLWKMTWCFKNEDETKMLIENILNKELGEKSIYRNTDISKLFPNPKIKKFISYLGLEFWKARVLMVETISNDYHTINNAKNIFKFLKNQKNIKIREDEDTKNIKIREDEDTKNNIVRTNSQCECINTNGKPKIYKSVRGRWCYIDNECVDSDPHYCEYASDAPYNYVVDEDMCWDWVDKQSYKNYMKKHRKK
jgi:GNAT superfamily N-acetyltransferase